MSDLEKREGESERDYQKRLARERSAEVQNIEIPFPPHLKEGDGVPCLRHDLNVLFAYCEGLAAQLRTAGITNIAPPPWPSVDTE